MIECLLCVSLILGGWSHHPQLGMNLNEVHNTVGVHLEIEDEGFLLAQYKNSYRNTSRMYLFSKRQFIDKQLDVLYLGGLLDGYHNIKYSRNGFIPVVSVGLSFKIKNHSLNLQVSPYAFLMSFSVRL